MGDDPGETKRGFCSTCGSHLAALDYGDTTVGINLSALDDQHDPHLAPVNQSFRSSAVAWLPQVPDTTQHRWLTTEAARPGSGG